MSMITNQTIVSTAKRFGTPVYLYDMENIEDKYNVIRNGLSKHCDIYYSMKANPLLAICECLRKAGAGCEVSSMHELLMALKAGFSSNQIIFVGPGKKYVDLKCAIENKIRYIVCESIDEIVLINDIGEKYNQIVPILIRINPDFSVATAPIKMSGVATQFGINVDFFLDHIDIIKSQLFISLEGIQIYNASRVLDSISICENVNHIFELSKWLSQKCNILWKTVDFGGGLGVPYFDGESHLEVDTLLHEINKMIDHYVQGYPDIKFILELGRYLTAESGYLIGSVQTVKKSHEKNFAVVDSGMHCHLGATGMGSFVHRNFPMRHVSMSSPDEIESEKINYHIVGSLCTPGDVLIKNVFLDVVKKEDLIVIEKTGAYGLTASPGRFLSHGSPAEVVYENETLTLSRRRENITDLLLTQTTVGIM